MPSIVFWLLFFGFESACGGGIESVHGTGPIQLEKEYRDPPYFVVMKGACIEVVVPLSGIPLEAGFIQRKIQVFVLCKYQSHWIPCL